MSSTVDTRIVEMQFNNKQFEKNVSQSMSTLKELRKQLDSTESAKGLEELANAAKAIDLRNISESIANIESRFSTMGIVGMTIIQDLTNSGLNALRSMSSYITNMIKTGGLKRAMNIEQAKFSLEGLGVAWEKVANQITFAVDNTAYGLDQAAVASSSLIASSVGVGNMARQLTELGEAGEMGVDYIDSLGMSLKAISGVAAQTNSDYASIANIFTTIAGQGKLMTMQLNQLANRGLNVAAKLGEALGKTEAEVRDMVSKGQIDFDTFSGAMYDMFADHASAANDTYTGVAANIKSAFSKIGADIFSPIIENKGPLVQMLEEIRAKVNGLRKLINGADQFTENVTYVALSAIDKIRQALASLGSWEDTESKLQAIANRINDIGQRIKEVGQYIFKSAPVTSKLFNSYIKPVFEDSEGTLDVLKEKLIESGEALTAIDIRGLIEKEGSFIKSLKAGWLTTDVFGRTIAYASEYITAFENGTIAATEANKKEYKQMKQLITAFSEGYSTVAEFYVILNQPTAIENIGKAISNVFSGIKIVLKSIKKAWTDMFDPDYSGIILSITQSLVKLSEVFVLNNKQSSELVRTFKGVFAAADILRRIVSAGLNFAFKVLQGVLNAFNMDVLSTTATIGDAIVKFREWFIQYDLISTAAESTATVIVKFINTIARWYKAFKEMPAVKAAVTGIQSAFETAWKFAKPIIEEILTAIKEMFTEISEMESLDFTRLGEIFGTLNQKVQAAAKGVGQALASFTVSAVISAFSAFKAILAGLGVQLKATEEDVKSFGGTLLGFVKSINWGEVGALAAIVAQIVLVVKTTKLIKQILAPLDMFKVVCNALANAIGNLGKVFLGIAVLEIAGSIMLLAKAMKIMSEIPKDDFVKSVATIGAMTAVLTGIMVLLAFLPAEKLELTAIALSGIAGALLLLSGSLFVLAYTVEKYNPWEALGVLLVLLGELLVFSMGMSIVAPRLLTSGLFLLSFAASIGVLAFSLRLVALLPTKEINSNLSQIAGIFATLATVMILARVAGSGTAKFGAGMLGLAASLLIVVGIVSLLDKVKWSSIDNGILVITAIGGLFALFGAAARIAGDSAHKAGVGLLAMSAAISLLVGLMVIISWISDDTLAKGITVISAISVILDGMIACLGFLAKHTDEASLKQIKGLIITFTVLFGVLIGEMIWLSKCDKESIYAAAASIGAIGVAVSALLLVIRKTENISWSDSLSAMGELISIVLTLTIIGSALAWMSGEVKNVDAVIPLAASISLVLLSLAASVKLMDKIKLPDKSSRLSSAVGSMCLALIGIAVALSGVSAAIAKTGANWTQVLSAAAGLSLVLVALAATMRIMNGLPSLDKGIAGTFFILSVALLPIAAALALITGIMKNPTDAITAAVGLSAVLVALTGVAYALSLLGAGSVATVTAIGIGVAAILAVEVALLGLVGILALISGIGNLEQATASILSLAGVIVALTVCAAVLAVIGLFAPVLTVGVAVLAIMIVLVGLLGLITWGLSAIPNVDKGILTLYSMATMIKSLSETIVLLASMGVNCIAAIAGVALLTTLIVDLAVLTLIIGEVFNLLDSNGTIIDTGLEVLGKLGTGLGDFIGNLIGGVLSKATEVLPAFGEAVGAFWDGGMKKFIEGFKDFDPTIADSMVSFAEAFVAMTATGWIDKILTSTLWSGDAVSFKNFGSTMSQLTEGLKEFDANTSELKPHALKTKAEALVALVTALSTVPRDGGIEGLIMGTKDIKGFAEGIKDIIPALEEMSVSKSINKDNIIAAADGIAALVKAGNSLPEVGTSLRKFITGDKKSLKAFAEELTTSEGNGKTIIDALVTVGSQGSTINSDGVDKAVSALSSLITSANDLPSVDGKLQGLIGHTKDLKTFATELSTAGDDGKTIGQALVDLGKSGADINNDGVKAAATAISTLEENLPTESGTIEKFFSGGTIDMGEFGDQVGRMAEGISTFVENTQNVDSSAAARISTIGAFVKNLGEVTSQSSGWSSVTDLYQFGSDLVNFGDKLKKFINKLDDMDFDLLEVSLDAIENIYDVFGSLTNVNSENFNGLSEMLSTSGTALANSLIQEFDSDEVVNKAKYSIEALIRAMATKLDEVGYKLLSEKFHPILYKITGLVDQNEDNMYVGRSMNCGRYLVLGITKGLENEDATSALYKASQAIIEKSLQTMEETAEINSPSKQTAIIGQYLSAGLANGINDYASLATTAADGVTNDTLAAMRDAIANIESVLDSDMNLSPVISPVVDLSELQNGMNSVESMMSNRDLTLSANMTAGSIAGNFSSNSDGVSDIVRKLDSLDKRLSTLSANNYTINGITYDDGTAVSEAVKSLVRAAKIERRM